MEATSSRLISLTGVVAKEAAGAAASKAVAASFDMNVSDWRLSRKTRRLVEASSVLGNKRSLNCYIKTPLIAAMLDIMVDSGVVYVDFAPKDSGSICSLSLRSVM